MGQVGQAVQGGMSQGSSTTPSAPAAPVGNAYAAPVALPAQLPGNYQDARARDPQQQPFPQQQQSSWQQNPEWQGYQNQMQDLQNKMRTYSQQYQPPQMQQQQNQQYQPRSRDGWGYGGRGGSNWGQQQGPFQGGGLAGLLSGLGLGGNSMFKNGGKVE